MTENEKSIVIYLYLFGWITDWGYYMARAMQEENIWITSGSILLGWLPALLWPLHGAIEFWSWILGG